MSSKPEFPCGLIVTDSDKTIQQVNAYFENHLFIEKKLIGCGLDSLFSKASLILFESYLYPRLVTDGKAEELQASIYDGKKTRLPVVINAELQSDKSIHWAVFVSISRNRLYEELLSTRETLESNIKTLRLTAQTDDLTGLLNRKEALVRIHKMFMYGFRQKKFLSIILFDIDFFKQVNDVHGHSVGDKVIVEVAAILKSSVRTTDVVARWGGEEFLMVVYDLDTDDSRKLCRRIQLETSEMKIPGLSITLSGGLVSYCPGYIPSEVARFEPLFTKLINNADAALYTAKQNGRNKTVVFSD